jgi:mRNA interferase RelE/StbE
LIGDLAGLYSARRGDYRIIYTIDKETIVVEVADVRRRSDV